MLKITPAARRFTFVFASIIVCALLIQVYLPVAHADLVAQTLPFTQNWTNTGLITTNDNWSSVPGIIGYRGDDLTTSTGTNPQTILADGSGTPVNVIANQTNPDTLTSGGVAEFDTLANPTIALNGSGTADAPHIVINISTAGLSGVNVSYNLRDLDGSADNSVQPVALQYRVGNSGNYTNIPQGFVADATTGPSQATLVTPVAVTLPSSCDNQGLVQLRIITTNAVGNDEWVGIDDINVSAGPGGPVNLSGFGNAAPPNVMAGGTSFLTVAVTPGTMPDSTGITVQGDLTALGGTTGTQFFDDGTHGDVVANDNTFSLSETTMPGQTPGTFVIPIAIADAQTRTATTTITLTVNASHSPLEHLIMGNPSDATADVNNPNNFLIMRDQYAESYNRDSGEPNWVSWHLDSSWLGSTPRQDDYRNDPSLPAGWYQVQATDYSGSGFDRGHMCPSGDRTSSVPDNSATFLMTNFVPQAPNNNQGPWEEFESYCRTLVSAGNELYIISGPAGIGGSGSNGGETTTIANGNVVVPAYTWKVVLVLPVGDNDVDRVNRLTRTIAVIMPNRQDLGLNTPWRNFRVNVGRVEALTGYSFFKNVRPQMYWLLKRHTDFQ